MSVVASIPLLSLLSGTPALAYQPSGVGACLASANGVISGVSSVGNGGATVTASSYTVAATDGCTDVLFNSASGGQSLILPRPTTAGFGYGWGFDAVNLSTAQAITVTPTGSVLPNNATSLSIAPNTQCVFNVTPDGNNWYYGECSTLVNSAAAISSIGGDLAATGPGAVTGTIQPNVVTNAKLAQGAALCVKANATNAAANYGDLCDTPGTNAVLVTNSAGTALLWGSVNLATMTTGQLATAHGGTGATFPTIMGSGSTPTISALGTSPAATVANGTLAFAFGVGSGGSAASGTLTLPAANHGWFCNFADPNVTAAVFATRQTGIGTTTSVPFGNFTSAGASGPWASGDTVLASCLEY